MTGVNKIFIVISNFSKNKLKNAHLITLRWFHPKWTALDKIPVENRSLFKEGTDVSQVLFHGFNCILVYNFNKKTNY